MISGMRKDILVAGFLLSIIDRYKGNILVVCPNSFFTISGYTAKRHKRRKLCYGAKDIRADMRWQQHLELERLPFQPESIQETGH